MSGLRTCERFSHSCKQLGRAEGFQKQRTPGREADASGFEVVGGQAGAEQSRKIGPALVESLGQLGAQTVQQVDINQQQVGLRLNRAGSIQ